MEHLIALRELPTAVLCSNDMTAIGFFMRSTRRLTMCRRRFPLWDSTTFIWPSHAAAANHGADVLQ